MKQALHTLEIATRGQGLYDFTASTSEWLRRQELQTGLLTVFCRHTSASLLIQENADPTVRVDLKAYFDRIAPEDGPYEHDSEGADDMPAHLKTALTQVQLSIPVSQGRLALGMWQGIYLFEHRVRPPPAKHCAACNWRVSRPFRGASSVLSTARTPYNPAYQS